MITPASVMLRRENLIVTKIGIVREILIENANVKKDDVKTEPKIRGKIR